MTEPFEVRRKVELDATPEQVWEAIATGPGLATWFMPMDVDPDSGMVAAWEPGKHLMIQLPAAEDGATQAFEYLIEARDGGSTVLRFVHSGLLADEEWSDGFETMTGAGWDMYLFTLAQYFRHFAGRPSTYIEADGPAVSSQPDRWPQVARALGDGHVGTPVQVVLDGVGVVEGQVDYEAAAYIGIRTADALIRFHGRAPIGMTVAVSHHHYGERVDASAVAQAWRTWLAAVFG